MMRRRILDWGKGVLELRFSYFQLWVKNAEQLDDFYLFAHNGIFLSSRHNKETGVESMMSPRL